MNKIRVLDAFVSILLIFVYFIITPNSVLADTQVEHVVYKSISADIYPVSMNANGVSYPYHGLQLSDVKFNTNLIPPNGNDGTFVSTYVATANIGGNYTETYYLDRRVIVPLDATVTNITLTWRFVTGTGAYVYSSLVYNGTSYFHTTSTAGGWTTTTSNLMAGNTTLNLTSVNATPDLVNNLDWQLSLYSPSGNESTAAIVSGMYMTITYLSGIYVSPNIATNTLITNISNTLDTVGMGDNAGHLIFGLFFCFIIGLIIAWKTKKRNIGIIVGCVIFGAMLIGGFFDVITVIVIGLLCGLVIWIFGRKVLRGDRIETNE